MQIEWPAGVEGVGILEPTGFAPTFFEIDNGVSNPSPIPFRRGGSLTVNIEEKGGRQKTGRFHVRPVEPRESESVYWDRKQFGDWGTTMLPPGRYVVSVLFPGEDAPQTKEVTIEEGRMTSVSF